MNKEVARKVCELVAGILAADGEMHPAEGKLLGRVVKALGDPFDFGQHVQPMVRGSDAAHAVAELPQDVRDEALELMIEAAIVDGKVLPAEQQYLAAVAQAMQLDPDELDERIAGRLLDG